MPNFYIFVQTFLFNFKANQYLFKTTILKLYCALLLYYFLCFLNWALRCCSEAAMYSLIDLGFSVCTNSMAMNRTWGEGIIIQTSEINRYNPAEGEMGK